jgi:amino acid adenylation domain-containing protein
VIYTSGSTGLPKGALVEHKGMLNHLYAKIVDLQLTAADRVAQTASQCFDISVWQALAALLVGGQVHLFEDDIAHNPARLLAEVERHRITVLESVPSLLRVMVESAAEAGAAARPSLAALRWMIPTGEALPPELCRAWFQVYPNVPLLNAYGPTECSDDVTHAPIFGPPAGDVVRMPIGRPVANMRLYVLDAARRPVPIGVVGELYVGGIGVGRGYLNDPARTNEAFSADPFDPRPDARLYKTGDLGRWRADGMLEYVGRVDHQVKLRGFRIELGEIEAVLRQHAGVADVAVLAREDVPGRQELVAYVAPPAGGMAPAPRELREFVGARLPAYMVPSAVVALERLPLTPNGKVDRRALPAPQRAVGAPVAAGRDEGFVAPRTPTEARLAGIWATLLGVERVGIHDNFFELGGSSIISMQIVAQAADAGLRLTTRDLYQCPTIAELAAQLERPRAVDGDEGDVAEDTRPGLTASQQRLADRLRANGAEDVYPLSPMQAGILVHALSSPTSRAYCLQFACRLSGAIDEQQLVAAWQAAVDRHASLRTSFRWEGLEEPLQVVRARARLPIACYDWRALSADEQQRRRAAYLQADRERGFALDRAPLARLALFRTADDAGWLVFSFHHLILDGWSLARVLGEVFGTDQLLPRSRPYRDYITWLQRQDMAAAQAFWHAALADVNEPTPLGGELAARAETHSEQAVQLTETATHQLEAFARHQRLTLNTVIRGAWALVLSEHSRRADVVFGATVAGRSPALRGSEAMVGVLINTLPVRARIDPNAQLVDWLRQLQAEDAATRQYDYCSLAEVQGWSGVPRGRALFESNFVFENYPLDQSLLSAERSLRIAEARVFEQGTLPLTLMAIPGATLTLAMSYDGERFLSRLVRHLLDRLQQVLARMMADAGQPLAAIIRIGDQPSLAVVGPSELPSAEYVAPRTDVEAVVATIWSDVLQIERVSVEDSFFELGGHSLMVTQVIARLNDCFGTNLPLRTLFESPTVAGIAEALVRHEIQPGRTATVARLHRKVGAMTPEQVRAALQARQRAALKSA